MSYLKGIHDLGYIAQRVQGGGGAFMNDDWVTFSANLGGIAGKGLWYFRDKWKNLAKGLTTTGPIPTPTAIVDVAIVVVSVIDLLNGFLSPDKGDSLEAGAQAFDSAIKSLELATADPAKWSGQAAEAYAQQNAELQALLSKLETIDKRWKAVIVEHGDMVNRAHQTCAICLMVLVLAQGIAMLLWAFPALGGPVASVKFQLATVAIVAAAVMGHESMVMKSSTRGESVVGVLTSDYETVGTRASLMLGNYTTIRVAGAEETSVGSFAAISESLSAFAGTPTVASLANIASQSAPSAQRAAINAFLDGGDTAVEDSPEKPQNPDKPAAGPTTPGFTPPTIDQVTRASAQAAKLSGHLSQHMNFATQAAGSLQQLASTGQQDRARAAPIDAAEKVATEQATPADAAHGAGAGLDTKAGERAPIDPAVEPTVPQDPEADWAHGVRPAARPENRNE